MELLNKKVFNVSTKWLGILIVGLILVTSIVALAGQSASKTGDKSEHRIVTVYDRGTIRAFVSEQKTVGEALEENGFELDDRDTVEPSRDEEMVATDYRVNIYRARPVVVIDGETRIKIMSPYQTAQHIAKDAGIILHREDIGELHRSRDYIGDGAGLQMMVKRATPLKLDLYGKVTEVRTQAQTIGEMLDEKKIILGENGRVSLALSTKITAGLEVRVWREGKQTITLDQAIPFETERIFDADREVGYRQVQANGVEGVKAITYEVEIKDGIELSRQEIAQIVTKPPVKQIEVIGIKPGPNALTKSKGAQYFTDSKGVSHRETYYDLPMGVVMGSCGQGGYYTVRPGDGAKVDRDGYVIVAANYGNYPKCSVVETSMGPGKVYDTGGFALRHPHGFDLATDWTRADGI